MNGEVAGSVGNDDVTGVVTDGNTGAGVGCCGCPPNVVDVGWLSVEIDAKLNPLAGLDVDPKADDAGLSDGAVVADCPKKNVDPNGAGAAVVTVTFDDPNDSVVAAGLSCD